ncbi:MAG TPA: hypothetical protein VEA16_06900 [Vicinamibacterales bacterium]|nr:hypothetical protein [Vicinamibacterales bacterium]
MKKLIPSCLVVLALAAPVLAQDAPPANADQQIQVPVAAAPPPPAPASAPKPINLADLRHHVYVMEGALARAVDYGAKQLNRDISAVMPSVFMLEGEARARGVHLDGYGVFFDVRVPSMRQSMMWSLRVMMEQDTANNLATVAELRRSMQGVSDPATRASMEKAIRTLERQNQPALRGQEPVVPGLVVSDRQAPAVGAATAAGLSTPAPPAAPMAADPLWMKDPDRAYMEAVTRALVDAMIDYSTPMAIPADQWLTVAARDDEGRDSLAPQDPLEEVFTMIYRIKGSDLHLYRAGKIDRDEVRKRVQLSQF